MKIYYCWRCKADLPFLEDDEWRQMSPYLQNTISQIKAYRKKHGCSLAQAKNKGLDEASKKFAALTGVANFNAEAIYHHRLDQYGPECPSCHRLLRTKRARKCFHCGEPNPSLGNE